MSLTSYRAAPPRGGDLVYGYWCDFVFDLGRLEDLAATYSPVP